MEVAITQNQPYTFEQVWQTLQEVIRVQRENAEAQRENVEAQRENVEAQRKNVEEQRKIIEEQKKSAEEQRKGAEEWKERQRKNAEEMKEWKEQQRETERQMKKSSARVDQQLGKLGNRFGEMVEYMVMPNLVKKFRKMGFGFTEAYPHAVIEDKENNIFTEIDITLKNGKEVMIVEVKSKPTTKDITDHIRRMEKIQLHSKLHGHQQQFFGAIAGMVLNNNEKEFAFKNGFYVIEPSGETFTITAPEGIYSVKEW
jgi:hypothetical protein